MRNIFKKISKDAFFRPGRWAILVNPYFIARRGLYQSISAFAKSNPIKGKILDVGCGSKPYESLFKGGEYTGIDIKGGGHYDQAKTVDQFFDGRDIPYPGESFDLVICTQVLEHSEDPEYLVGEMFRVLEREGLVYITMPFVWSEHEVPYDFRRFTRYQHEKMLKSVGFEVQRIEPTCGVFGVCGQLLSVFIFETIGGNHMISKLLISSLLCFPIQLVAVVLDFIFKNNWITLDYAIVAKKYDL